MVGGAFLTAPGVLGLIITGLEFNSLGDPGSGEEFILWSNQRLDHDHVDRLRRGRTGDPGQRGRCAQLLAGRRGVLAVIAVWGFIDGSDVASIIVADTTNYITHAVLGGLGLVVGLPSGERQRDKLEGDPRSVRQQRLERTPPAANGSRYPTGVNR